MGRLITLGDSWMKGVGTEYQEGMTQDHYHQIKFQESKYCFRNLVSHNLNLTNIDLSRGGSSNQKQFRLALETFFGRDKIKPSKDDIVMWGITSVFRTELWNNKNQRYEDIYLPPTHHNENSAVSKILTVNHHDENKELEVLGNQLHLWNAYFKSIGIKNFWFNMFNDNKWSQQVDNLLFEGSSLLSCLIDDHSPNDKYHMSDWNDVDRKIKRAKEMNLVNPFTGHPNRSGHKKIAELIQDQLTKTGRIVN
jgi:hypothetical protein